MQDYLSVMTESVENHFGCKVKAVRKQKLGKDEAVVFSFGRPPYCVAVKSSDDADKLEEEFNRSVFFHERVGGPFALPFYFQKESDGAFYVFGFTEGVSLSELNIKFKRRKKKKALTFDIVNAFIKMQKRRELKYGFEFGEKYDTWYDFYSECAEEIYLFCQTLKKEGKLENSVFEAVRLSFENLSKIIEPKKASETEADLQNDDEDEPDDSDEGELDDGLVQQQETAEAVLAHGGFSAENFIVDPETLRLKMILAPSFLLWAEPEYELYELLKSHDYHLELYELYKMKIQTSPVCDLKTCMYSLYSELHKLKEGSPCNKELIATDAQELLRLMKKQNII